MSNNVNQLMPELKPLDNQLGGHGINADKKFFFEIPGGFIAKRLKKYSRGYQEAEFYNEILKSNDFSLKRLSSFFPRYYGMCDNIDPIDKFIYLENIFYDLRLPSSADIKIGRLNSLKYPVAEEVLFQICGMQAFLRLSEVHTSEGTNYCIDKAKGKLLVPGTIKEEFTIFFKKDTQSGGRNRTKILKKLREISELVGKQTSWHFISSSVIIAYDNHNIEKGENFVVKMIDFSHATPSSSPDHYTINGLRNLIDYISSL